MQTLQSALADIPHIQGVNNHTGSELTAVAQPMQWLMQELKERGLYFVDSVTTSASVAAATAEQYQVPSLRRHVFLDNIQTAEAIDFEFKRALALARKQGFAVAIAHPYTETLAYLEAALPLLAEDNIKLISASAMIAQLNKPERVETTAAW
ncbi:MAG: divergent polysaccharide deacetylase family protein [Gammaproteobacteria bacterium]|nr:divergent polysaccharide deacetylase family protein [Gammaproteobacteria bacterium]